MSLLYLRLLLLFLATCQINANKFEVLSRILPLLPSPNDGSADVKSSDVATSDDDVRGSYANIATSPGEVDPMGLIREEDLFVLEMDEVDPELAGRIAQGAGFRLVRPIRNLRGFYVAERLRRRKRSTDEIVRELMTHHRIQWSAHVSRLRRTKRRQPPPKDSFTDASIDSFSMGIPKAWGRGLTGNGVTVAIVDDGIDYHHPALSNRYRADLSFDFNNNRADAFPENLNEENSHGTNCAGLVSMSPSSLCGTGIAWRSSIASVKVLQKDMAINDVLEAESLLHQNSNISIYSVSWGPTDDGKAIGKPGRLAEMALETTYRTLTFGVYSSSLSAPSFAEGCSSVLASVSEGVPRRDGTSSLTTTTVSNGCSQMRGSSAAAPVASAILALAMEANPHLTQRDIQHLVVRTSDSREMRRRREEGWKKNGAGLWFHPQFGFGQLDADRLTRAVVGWKGADKENRCEMDVIEEKRIFDANTKSISFSVHGCEGTSSEIRYVERVVLQLSFEHSRRGAVEIWILSPSDRGGRAKRSDGPRVWAKRSGGPRVWAKRSGGPRVWAKRDDGPRVWAKRSGGPRVWAKRSGGPRVWAKRDDGPRGRAKRGGGPRVWAKNWPRVWAKRSGGPRVWAKRDDGPRVWAKNWPRVWAKRSGGPRVWAKRDDGPRVWVKRSGGPRVWAKNWPRVWAKRDDGPRVWAKRDDGPRGRAKRGGGPRVWAKRSDGPRVWAKRSGGPRVWAKRDDGPRGRAKRGGGPRVWAKRSGGPRGRAKRGGGPRVCVGQEGWRAEGVGQEEWRAEGVCQEG